jgi:threonine/homoserine/homoserine lactone efflux protein
MGIGGLVFSSLAVLGLRALLSEVSWLYVGVRVLGGAYLVYMAIGLWREAREPIMIDGVAEQHQDRAWRSLRRGFATQLSNPKTAIVYSGVFAAFLPANPQLWLVVCLPPLIFLVEMSWYTTVALALSSVWPRRAYMRAKPRIDRLAAAVIGGLGLRFSLGALTRYI